MNIERREREGHVVLEVEGAIRLGESGKQLADALKAELDAGTEHLMLELSRINYVDSTGVGELVGYLTRFSESGRRMVLVNPSLRIRTLLQIARIEHLFEIYDSVEEALGGADSE